MDDFPSGGPGGRGWCYGCWGAMHGGTSWAGWLFMGLALLLLLALVVAAVWLLTRYLRAGAPTGRPGPTGPGAAEHLLDERFARGEIDEEEYLRRRSVLRGG